MDEVVTQVAAPPLFINQNISGRFHESGLIGKKRSVVCYSTSNNHKNQISSQVNKDGWNPNAWEWDSPNFVAEPLEQQSNAPNLVSLGNDGGNDEPPRSCSRPNKKDRSGSPGSGGDSGNYPMCQVDDCKEDLSKSKDYHRRHKVCVFHSKAKETGVRRQLQRFCQQCSRFHPLSKFDEEKRSCRSRLENHNQRRRKTQPEDATSPVVHPTDSKNGGNVNLDIVNLLTILTHGQGIAEKSISNSPPLPDKNQLIEILSTFNAAKPQPTNLPTSCDTPSTKNIFKQPSLVETNIHVNPTASNGEVQDPQKFLPLRLFSPSPPETVSSQKYFSSNSSRSSSPSDERSQSPSVPPVTRNLFPLETASSEMSKSGRMSICEDANNLNVEGIKTGTFSPGMTLDLFGLGNIPYRGGYASSSDSDHSPPSFDSDPQEFGKDLTGRIVFKLFDKDPGHFPGTLRSQINNWLSNSPLEMESFIRPGCVVLSIYVSMPSTALEKVEENFSQLVSNLIQGSESEFWRSGRFSVNIGRQLAFHKDGKFIFCKPGNSPELVVVSPLAVVRGQSTSLVIKGRKLTSPGTKIHCAYMGKYSSKEVFEYAYQGLTYDEIRLSNFKVDSPTSVLGRCFIEVENGGRGNSFPIIIADAKICRELKLLEHEFDKGNTSSPNSHNEILCFLNELGWLFQTQSFANRDYSLNRFRYLLTVSIERDYCALVKTILDIYAENGCKKDGLSIECVEEALYKMHLLHRAVKKRSKRMVDMLIHYSAPFSVEGGSKRYVFPPNSKGPGAITPLHLAACISGSYDIVDILTDDPLQIGLHSWKSLLDDNGQSPSAYATMRNDDSLNSLVTQKLIDKANSQVSLSIGSEIVDSSELKQRSTLEINKKKPESCSKCAMMMSYSIRMPGSNGVRLHRPFIHSMLAIAAVCVCVCLFFKSMGVPLTWENLHFGSI